MVYFIFYKSQKCQTLGAQRDLTFLRPLHYCFYATNSRFERLFLRVTNFLLKRNQRSYYQKPGFKPNGMTRLESGGRLL